MTSVHDTGTETLRCQTDDGVATLVFDNPATHNAMSAEIRRALPPTLARLEADDEVRVVIVTGAGERAFMSGADISEFGDQRTDPAARAAYDRASADVDAAWAAMTVPIIAAVRGYCLGAGLLTALSADIRLAADDAQFAIPAARLGLGYAFGNVEKLMEVVGPAHAAELLYSARRYTAEEARAAGLVNRVVPAAELRDEAMELAASIAANAPLTVAACKAGIQEVRRPAAERNRARVDALVEACFTSEDYLEGQAAFLEKRRPHFTGR